MRPKRNRLSKLAIVVGALCAGCLCSQPARAQTTSWSFHYTPTGTAFSNWTGTTSTWTAPSTGMYAITAYGAQGGHVQSGGITYDGGRGAVIGGSFLINSGDTLTILVGAGGLWSNYGGSGGGGSFVVTSSTVPLVVAGGGGGAGAQNNGIDASTTTSGNNAAFSATNAQGSGGTDGSGGSIGVSATFFL